MQAIDPEVLNTLREREGKWAAYENQAFDSQLAGHLQFLKIGEGCTFQEPPKTYPKDTVLGMGWRYVFVGEVDLKTGNIKVVGGV